MATLDVREALSVTRPLGPEGRTLRVGSWAFAFEGLDAAAAVALDRRWGGFVVRGVAAGADAAVRLLEAGPGCFLEPSPGETYRFGTVGPDVVSYHLAARREEGERWRAAIAASDDEPRERILDNLARLLVARVALRSGGMALHGAGIRRAGRAFIFAGPSGSGKSTASRLALPDASLGDDFAVIVPVGSAFAAPAVPFDNGERAPAAAPSTLFPLAGVFRLTKAEPAGVTRLAGPAGTAALVACAAFPWAVPDLAERWLPVADAIVRSGLFADLRFGRASEVGSLIEGPWGRSGPA